MEGDASPASSSNGGSSSNNGSILVRQKGPMRIENPFTLKVGQVFTGFGVGCGLGIGVGRPLNLGAVPVLNQVMTAASGATYAFSGVARHVNNSLKKVGAKNIEAGIGCGIGFGHGFGVGLALKPGVVHQIQLHVMEAMINLMMKFGVGPNLSVGQVPAPVQTGMNVGRRSSLLDSMGSAVQFGENIPATMVENSVGNRKVVTGIGNLPSERASLNLSFGTQSEKLINSFLKDPVLREDTELHERDGKLQSENKVLRMVLKHQQVIEQLIEENERLHQILVEDLKIPPRKLQKSYTGKIRSPCVDCFECRRKERRR